MIRSHSGGLSSMYANRRNAAAEHASALQCLKGLVEKHNIVFVST